MSFWYRRVEQSEAAAQDVERPAEERPAASFATPAAYATPSQSGWETQWDEEEEAQARAQHMSFGERARARV
jgi:hypothetical protein